MLYLDQERFLDSSKSVRGGIPVLFPICGGLPGDRLPLPQGEFTLPRSTVSPEIAPGNWPSWTTAGG